MNLNPESICACGYRLGNHSGGKCPYKESFFLPVDGYDYPPENDEPMAKDATLKDCFARAALAALISSGRFGMNEHRLLAQQSYDYAEAMIAERKKREKKP